MSTSPETELDLELQLLPAWAQQPADKADYSRFERDAEREEQRRGRGDRGDRGDRPRGPRPPRDQRDQRGERRGPPRDRDRGPGQGQGQGRGPGGERRGQGPQRGKGRPDRGQGPRPEPVPLPEIDVQFLAEEHVIDSLVRQIRMTGRAYPLFGIAQLILEKPERHAVQFTCKKGADGNPLQPLFVCAVDDTVWLSEDEAVAYVLDKHFALFYQAERTQTDPPKGVYTFVAQCGISGIILGPPNHHDYQNQLRKLHSERFARMPFDMFKSRVKIVRDEAVVKKWVEDQSWKTEYTCLNVPEPLKLATRAELDTHFRQTHLANIIQRKDSQRLEGPASRAIRCTALQRLVRVKWDDQKRFPLQIATLLSQQFAQRGLQFFKVNKSVTHVAVARPHYLDLEATPVSDNVRKLVDFINANPKCTRRKLFEAVAPSAVQTVVPPAEGAPSMELTTEASLTITDLHWLIHQGHVIEFANGTLETAKKPVPRPQKAAPAEAATTTESTSAGTPAPEAVAQPAAVEAGPDAVLETSVAPEVAETPAPPVPVAAEVPAPSTPDSNPA